MTDASETLRQIAAGRYSCRAYLPETLSRDEIKQVTEIARRTPSWCNAQPWHLEITRGEETDKFREALYAHAVSGAAPEPDLPWPEGYPGIYGDRRRACGFQLYDAVGIEKGDRAASARQMMENFRFFGAPHVAILSSPKVLGPYGALDCGGFVTAFCWAAQSLGIASIPQAAVASYAPFVRDWFKIPEDRDILCAISFGRADPDQPVNGFRTERAAPEDLVTWKD